MDALTHMAEINMYLIFICFISLAWPDNFFPFLFVVAEKKALVWFTYVSHLDTFGSVK